ncbi:hypothetical protein HHL17_21435 [Chitinophaga sp. G-6-1-13]|uniref:YCII-related domain-containing protein n=1 Tax=Chitinophaga fulva TaxID=2728842 RepID=A0A848GMW1_9BACT|nr:YciI family protein [Chitinophaga fulva]NML39776.1 hypothetical protein [Chitinophaga fulva]
MQEFLVIIRGDGRPNTDSAQDMQQHLQNWQHWLHELMASGNYVGGQNLESEGLTVLNSTTVTDRPLAEGKELIAGYLVLRASNAAAAAELVKGCPSLPYGSTFEIRAIRQLHLS